MRANQSSTMKTKLDSLFFLAILSVLIGSTLISGRIATIVASKMLGEPSVYAAGFSAYSANIDRADWFAMALLRGIS
jgi:hypothetical protein